MAAKKYVREANEPSLVCHNPPPTPEMEEFAVKQEFKKEVDINYIIGRMQSGINPPQWMTANTPRYGDFSDMPASFQEAFEIVQTAQTAFMSLPLAMRKELDHNPQNLDHADKAMYEKYGLLNKPVVDERSGTPDASAASGTPTVGRQQKNLIKAPPGASKTTQPTDEE